MSAAESEAAIDRAVATYQAHGDNGAAYLLVVLAILARHAPEVLTFVMDRADSSTKEWS